MDAVAQEADDRVVDRVPQDPKQRAKRGQARLEPDHIREIDGIKDRAHHTHAGKAPIA